MTNPIFSFLGRCRALQDWPDRPKSGKRNDLLQEHCLTPRARQFGNHECAANVTRYFLPLHVYQVKTGKQLVVFLSPARQLRALTAF